MIKINQYCLVQNLPFDLNFGSNGDLKKDCLIVSVIRCRQVVKALLEAVALTVKLKN